MTVFTGCMMWTVRYFSTDDTFLSNFSHDNVNVQVPALSQLDSLMTLIAWMFLHWCHYLVRWISSLVLLVLFRICNTQTTTLFLQWLFDRTLTDNAVLQNIQCKEIFANSFCSTCYFCSVPFCAIRCVTRWRHTPVLPCKTNSRADSTHRASATRSRYELSSPYLWLPALNGAVISSA